jgi:hypothetical protein
VVHHGQDPADGMSEELRSVFNHEIGPIDLGKIKLAVGLDNGAVVLGFGTDVSCIGLDPADARALGRLLIEHADKADERSA